jgi:Domain of Unknown Function with PDB structure (DUF3857)/Domain of Unknown Function with PDB structure (DUF3858)
MSKNSLFLIVFLLFLTLNLCNAQEAKIKYGQITRSDIDMKVYLPDTSADAVVLYDLGEISMTFEGFFVLERTRQVKILKQKGVESQGTFLLKLDVDYEMLRSIEGKVVQSDGKVLQLKDNEFFKEKISDDRVVVKLVFPNLQEGSVLEVKYSLIISSLDLIKWSFQESIPIRRSALVLEIPDWVQYEYLYKGLLDYKTGTVEKDGDKLGSRIQVPVLIMDSIPAFREEILMPSKTDISCGVRFNWKKIKIPDTKKELTNDLNNMINTLVEHKKFGTQYEKKSNFGDVWKVVKPLLLTAKTSDDTLKTVYKYVSNNIQWIDNYFSPFVEKTLEIAFKKKKANSGEMNLMMIACLREAGVKCYPLLISTFEHGTPANQFLSIYQFDHVLCYVPMNGKEYFLDAGSNTFRNIYLPRRVSLNGTGWIVDKKNSKWIDLPKPLSSVSISSNLTLEKNGSINGNLTEVFEGYNAVDERDRLEKDPQKEYVKNEFSQHFTDFKLNSIEYENVENIYKPLTRIINCDITDATTALDSLVFLNPSTFGHVNQVSFPSNQRVHPIQFPYPIKEQYTFILTIPDNYKIEEVPPKFDSKLGEKEAGFSFNCTVKGNQIQIEIQFYINRLLYFPTEYKEVKSFFDNIVKKSNEQIILKKKL